MIRYSHVSLMIYCKDRSEADLISQHLGTQPSRLREDKLKRGVQEPGHSEVGSSFWILDSPKSAETADPTGRLFALADSIEPFSERLLTLDPRFHRFVDVVYHLTPQHASGITGEFDWLRMPAALMRRYAAWELGVSYEVFWFNHPDWVSPTRRSPWQRMAKWFHGLKSER